MVVVDSSALIPLSRVGELELIVALFDEVHTTEAVVEETTSNGYPGVSEVEAFLNTHATVHETPDNAARIADLEGIAVADASLVLLARSLETTLLTNDRALVEVARAKGVDVYWVTTLLLACVSEDVLEPSAAKRVLHDLVTEGMHLDPSVYARLRDRFDEA